jgi:glycosyltransferase involved in cell wall biosynthesis
MARVLIIAYTHYILDPRVKRHAEALADRGYKVDVICLDKDQQRQRSIGIIGIPLPRYRGHSYVRYVREYVRFFSEAAWIAARLNRKHHYDVVIACSMPDAAVVAGVIPKLSGSKLVLDIHDTMPELCRTKFPGTIGALGASALKVEERMSASLADLVFAVHHPHAKRLERNGIPREKIVVVLNVPDPRLFQRVSSVTTVAHEPFTIVTHGTINRRLGLESAMEAVRLVRDRIPKIRFHIIGSGEHKQFLERYAYQLGLGGIVEFKDPVPLEHLAAALQHASVGLVPNQANSATELMLPSKLLEYACLGIPVIAASLPTIRHYFACDTIRYFEPGSPPSLAESLSYMYSRPEERQVLASRANEVIKRLSWEKQRQNLYEAIERLTLQ